MMYKFTLFLVLLLTCYQKLAIVDAVTILGKKHGSHVMKRTFEDLSCAELIHLINNTNVSSICIDVESSIDLIFDVVFGGTFSAVNVTEDQLNSALNEFCSSECKELFVAYYRCFNDTAYVVSFYNDGICGRINQEYCMVRYLHGITSGVIIPLAIISNNCPFNYDSYFYYCIDGSCQNNVTKFIDYMECCAVPLLDGFLNSTTCDITNTDPCPSGIPSGVVSFQSSPLFAVLVLAAIIQVIIFYY